MMLPFTDGLVRTIKFDLECAFLADRHYSRRTIGSIQFAPPGETLILRNTEGTVLFVWRRTLWQRWDKQEGLNCTMFRNESNRLSSEIILEAEKSALEKWGPYRAFTYVDARKIASSNPGYCFKVAGWKSEGMSRNGLHLLTKQLSSEAI